MYRFYLNRYAYACVFFEMEREDKAQIVKRMFSGAKISYLTNEKGGFSAINLRRYLYFLFFLLLFACNKPEIEVHSAFYHWQTSCNIGSSEKAYLDSIQVQKLYFKFFDVDWEEIAQPAASIQWQCDVSAYEIVPTVFITNRTLLNIEQGGLADLAEKVAIKIKNLTPAQGFRELQLDCDWSEATEEKYFQLLRLLRTHFKDKTLSATIRLHQIKFFERTGVPPVDRGMLMCYNVGKIEEWSSENSILDTLIVSNYLQNFDVYPLELDIALPIFHWGLLFRDGSLSRILNNLDATALQDSTRFRLIAPNRFEVIKSTFLNGHFLYERDKIRLETVDRTSLQKTAQSLAQHLQNKRSFHLSFYHLDSLLLEQRPIEDLQKLVISFEK